MPVDFASLSRVHFEKLLAAVPLEPCPDQWVGTVDQTGCVDGPKKKFDRQPIADRPTGIPALILVLESPHVDEYEKKPNEDGICPAIGPANGTTGTNIQNHLRHFAADFTLNRHHSLLLINAVQHQCSAGVATSVHRDVLFRACWKNGGDVDFQTRLKAAFAPGDIVVNACTIGGDRTTESLKVLVERQIRAALEQPSDFWTNHPSSWRWARSRGVRDVPAHLSSETNGRAPSSRR